MITIEDMQSMLDDLVEAIPDVIFKHLNGGIVISPNEKESPYSQKRDLYILGQYHAGGPLGRYVTLYYGSFIRLYGHLKENAFKKKLDHTLKHELTHHLESLAGEKDLEIEDARQLDRYFKKLQT